MNEFFILYSTITFVSLIVTIFIVLLNLNDAKKDLKSLDLQSILFEFITFVIWIITILHLLKTKDLNGFILNFILFILSLIFGTLFIKSVITERNIYKKIKKIKNKQIEINLRLRELDKEKTEFISLVSHQLRGPLSSISGYSSMILEGEFGKVPKKLQDPLNKIFQSSMNVNSLINDFLDISKMEKNEVEYEIKPNDLVEILDNVVEEFKIAFERKEIKLISSHNKNDEVIVLCDFHKTKQMLRKILDNALKYTKIGSVTTSLAIKEGDAVITVVDTGIGIKQDEIKELFKKFKRASNASDITINGSGLGLYVAKEIIEAQGGRIWVESQGAGRGSKFFITLPIIKE